MRLHIRLVPVETGRLPPNYREQLQAMVYHHLPRRLAEAVHDGHYWEAKRPVKPFVFSQLHGEVRYERADGFSIGGPVWFRFASPAADLAQGLAEGLLRQGAVRIAHLMFTVEEIDVLPEPEIGPHLLVRTLSPVTVYRTVEHDGRKRTQYYNPLNREFAELVVTNLARKAEALGITVDEGVAVSVEPVGVGPRGRRLERYKGTWIEAWAGRFCLSGPEPLLRLALHAGLGAKNSQGFGYVDLTEPRRRSPRTEGTR